MGVFMRRLLQYLRPYRMSVVLILILLFLQALTSLYLPDLMSNIVDEGVVKGNIPKIIHIGEFMLLVTVVSVICSVTAGLLSSKASSGFGMIVRRKLFAHVESFMLKEFDKLGTSSLIVRSTNDIMQVQQFVNMLLRMMVMAPLMALGGIIMAIYTDARLSLILLVIMPVLGIAIYLVLSRSVALFRSMQGKVDDLNRVLREHLTGVRVIRSFQREDYEVGRFDDANVGLTDVSVRVYQIMAALMPVLMFIINFSTLAIIWFGGHLINDNQMQVGKLMAFIQYVTQIMFSVMMVSAMSFMIPRAQASARRINEVFDIHPTITNPATVESADQHRGHVSFEHVSFRYPGAQSDVLSDVSFALKPGEITAVIGGTGSGKSSLISLIPRFTDATAGQVLVDGVNVAHMDQRALRAKIGFVPQKAVLFSGTVAENIRYGNEGASEWAIRHAADIAQATEFIDEMPKGMDTVISQGGLDLSGGQKQRLSIARALVRKPEIYVFDDSFSALDFKTDAKLRAALHDEIADSTVLIVAQRVSTVIDADQILVLDEGQLVGAGTHDALMKSCDIYRQIVISQGAEEVTA